jgi:hypothetical protein
MKTVFDNGKLSNGLATRIDWNRLSEQMYIIELYRDTISRSHSIGAYRVADGSINTLEYLLTCVKDRISTDVNRLPHHALYTLTIRCLEGYITELDPSWFEISAATEDAECARYDLVFPGRKRSVSTPPINADSRPIRYYVETARELVYGTAKSFEIRCEPTNLEIHRITLSVPYENMIRVLDVQYDGIRLFEGYGNEDAFMYFNAGNGIARTVPKIPRNFNVFMYYNGWIPPGKAIGSTFDVSCTLTGK